MNWFEPLPWPIDTNSKWLDPQYVLSYMHPPAYMQSQSDRIGGDKHIKCVRHLRDIEPEEGHFCFELTKSNLLNFNTYESKSLTILARWKVDIFHFIFRLFGFIYREFSPYANFITANFITAVFQSYY